MSWVLIIISFLQELEEANNLYKERNYIEAKTKYESLIAMGVKSHIIYYNLGNCYFKLGELGESILWYKRAQKLKPADPDIEFNLDFARKRRIDKFTSELPKVFKYFINLLSRLSINSLLIGSTVLYFGLVYIISLSFFRKLSFGRNLILGIGIALLVTLTILFANLRRVLREEGVLTEKIGELRSGPSDEYTLIFTIHEGTEMRILETQKDWLKVRLPNKLEGWVRSNLIGKV